MDQVNQGHKFFGNLLKFVIFLVLFAALAFFVMRPFGVEDQRMYQHVTNFYREEDNSLDAVYIGSSNVYPWYEPPVVWDEYGIKSFDFSVPGMPARALKYVVEEALKSQPDALYIFNLNNFKNKSIGYVRIHNIADYMKFSKTKIDMINDLAEHSDIPAKERLEFIFPIIRFHSGWSQLTKNNFIRESNGLKGGDEYDNYFDLMVDQSKNVVYTSKREELKEYQKENLTGLVDYLKSRDVKALFVLLPQAVGEEKTVAWFNSMADYIKSEGFDVLDLLDEESDFDKIGLDYRYDFQDHKHVNVHGTQKYTRYFAEYLKDRYGFKDKRDDPGDAEWDSAVKKYFDVISPYTLDFERENSRRTLELDRPQDLTCTVDGTSVSVSWEPVDDADSYLIYRHKLKGVENEREITSSWKKIGETGKSDTFFNDRDVKKNKTYYYTIVPVKHEGSSPVYGCFDYTGVSVSVK